VPTNTETPTLEPTLEIPTETATVLPTETPIDLSTQTPTETPIDFGTQTPTTTQDFTTPTSTLESTLTPTPSELTTSLIFSDTFEDQTLSSTQWTFGLGWAYHELPDNTVLRLYNSSERAVPNNVVVQDGIIEANVLPQDGTVVLAQNINGLDEYALSLSSLGELRLTRSGIILAVANVVLPIDGTFTNLKFEKTGEILTGYINGVVTVTATDSVPLTTGSVAIYGLFEPLLDNSTPVPPQSTILVNDVSVWQISALPLATPVPTETPFQSDDEFVMFTYSEDISALGENSEVESSTISRMAMTTSSTTSTDSRRRYLTYVEDLQTTNYGVDSWWKKSFSHTVLNYSGNPSAEVDTLRSFGSSAIVSEFENTSEQIVALEPVTLDITLELWKVFGGVPGQSYNLRSINVGTQVSLYGRELQVNGSRHTLSIEYISPNNQILTSKDCYETIGNRPDGTTVLGYDEPYLECDSALKNIYDVAIVKIKSTLFKEGLDFMLLGKNDYRGIGINFIELVQNTIAVPECLDTASNLEACNNLDGIYAVFPEFINPEIRDELWNSIRNGVITVSVALNTKYGDEENYINLQRFMNVGSGEDQRSIGFIFYDSGALGNDGIDMEEVREVRQRFETQPIPNEYVTISRDSIREHNVPCEYVSMLGKSEQADTFSFAIGNAVNYRYPTASNPVSIYNFLDNSGAPSVIVSGSLVPLSSLLLESQHMLLVICDVHVSAYRNVVSQQFNTATAIHYFGQALIETSGGTFIEETSNNQTPNSFYELILNPTAVLTRTQGDYQNCSPADNGSEFLICETGSSLRVNTQLQQNQDFATIMGGADVALTCAENVNFIYDNSIFTFTRSLFFDDGYPINENNFILDVETSCGKIRPIPVQGSTTAFVTNWLRGFRGWQSAPYDYNTTLKLNCLAQQDPIEINDWRYDNVNIPLQEVRSAAADMFLLWVLETTRVQDNPRDLARYANGNGWLYTESCDEIVDRADDDPRAFLARFAYMDQFVMTNNLEDQIVNFNTRVNSGGN
jgi:hypothetical protein